MVKNIPEPQKSNLTQAIAKATMKDIIEAAEIEIKEAGGLKEIGGIEKVRKLEEEAEAMVTEEEEEKSNNRLQSCKRNIQDRLTDIIQILASAIPLSIGSNDIISAHIQSFLKPSSQKFNIDAVITLTTALEGNQDITNISGIREIRLSPIERTKEGYLRRLLYDYLQDNKPKSLTLGNWTIALKASKEEETTPQKQRSRTESTISHILTHASYELVSIKDSEGCVINFGYLEQEELKKLKLLLDIKLSIDKLDKLTFEKVFTDDDNLLMLDELQVEDEDTYKFQAHDDSLIIHKQDQDITLSFKDLPLELLSKVLEDLSALKQENQRKDQDRPSNKKQKTTSPTLTPTQSGLSASSTGRSSALAAPTTAPTPMQI